MSEHATRFADAARAFLAVLARDQADAIDLATALADLHAAALRLPKVSPSQFLEDLPEPRFDALPKLPLGVYWQALQPLDLNGDGSVGAGSLDDDLSEIRADVARGLALFDAGRVEEAVWDWRFGFWAHWGAHLVAAQRALHEHLAQG
jgi:hypothetical protein